METIIRKTAFGFKEIHNEESARESDFALVPLKEYQDLVSQHKTLWKCYDSVKQDLQNAKENASDDLRAARVFYSTKLKEAADDRTTAVFEKDQEVQQLREELAEAQCVVEELSGMNTNLLSIPGSGYQQSANGYRKSGV